MSETILKLLAEELAAIRVTCPNKNCGAITEVSLKRLPQDFKDYACPVCGRDFIPVGADRTAEHIKTFVRGVQGLAGLRDKVTIEIVVSSEK